MRRSWETVGQAFVDANFRRSRVLAGQPEDNQEQALAADHDIAAIHDRINRTPGPALAEPLRSWRGEAHLSNPSGCGSCRQDL